MKNLNKIMPIVGGLFTLLVIGLLLYGHLSTVEVPRKNLWATPPKILICDSAPSWVQKDSEEFQKAKELLESIGYPVAGVEVGICDHMCPVEGGEVPCRDGYITITSWKSWQSQDHAGQCFWPNPTPSAWAAIRVPEVVMGPDDPRFEGMFPAEVKAKVLAHELGHCLGGFDHALGPKLPFGARLNSPTGHVMNPNAFKVGWDTEGMGK